MAVMGDISAPKQDVQEFVSIWKMESDEGGFQNFQAGIDSMMSSIAGLTAIASAGSAAIYAVISRAAQRKEIEDAYQFLTGSADKASLAIEKLTNLANTTHLDREGLFQYGKELLKAGYKADELDIVLASLGNTASAVGKEQLPHLVESIAKMKKTGYADFEEMKKLMDAGIPIIEELAKSMGKSQAEIQMLVASKQITANDVVNVLTEMGQGGGVFSGELERKSLTVGSIIANIMAKFDELTIKIGKHLMPIWTEILLMADQFFDENKEEFTDALIEFFVDLSSAIVTSVRTLKSMFSWVGKLVGNFISWKKLISYFTAIFTGMFLYGLGMVVTTLYSMAGAVVMLGIVSATTIAKYVAIGALFFSVVLVLQDLITWLQGGNSLFADFWEKASKALKKFSKRATKMYEEIAQHSEKKIGPMLKRLFRVLIDSSKEFVAYLKTSGLMDTLDKMASVVGVFGLLTGKKDLGAIGGASKAWKGISGGIKGAENAANLAQTFGIPIPDFLTGKGGTGKTAMTVNNKKEVNITNNNPNYKNKEEAEKIKQTNERQLRNAMADAS